jgi:two-component system NtrC family sensor kinase
VPERVPVEVDRVIEEAVGLVRGDDRRAAVEIERQVAADAGELVTDPGLLRQILVNLFNNAADAVLSRGTGRVHVEARAAGEGLELSVRDDGAGIAPEDLARIFEPFYTTKGRGKGTGLGLAICRELAHALGGRIAVESAPGRGSVFTVSLPRQARAAA